MIRTVWRSRGLFVSVVLGLVANGIAGARGFLCFCLGLLAVYLVWAWTQPHSTK